MKKMSWLLLGKYWQKMGNFLFHHLVTLRRPIKNGSSSLVRASMGTNSSDLNFLCLFLNLKRFNSCLSFAALWTQSYKDFGLA